MIDTTKNYTLIVVYLTLPLIQGHNDVRKQNLQHHLALEWIWMEIAMLFRLVGLMNLILILSCLISFQDIHLKKKGFNSGLHSNT